MCSFKLGVEGWAISAAEMRVSGLTGRAQVANGVYHVQAGREEHRRPVYVQTTGVAGSRGPSRLVYDKTPGEAPAWMVELPDDPGKAYAYCEDGAQTPDAVREVWQVWVCGLTTPVEHGQWRAQPGFQVVAVEQRRDVEPTTATRVAPAAGPRPVPRAQAPASIEIRNHQYAEYNGQYAHKGDCEGYPYYSNRAGKHLFRPVGTMRDLKQWLLSSTLNPHDNVCEAYIECADTTPPLGIDPCLKSLVALFDR